MKNERAQDGPGAPSPLLPLEEPAAGDPSAERTAVVHDELLLQFGLIDLAMARLPLTATDGSASVECWFHLVGALAAIERVSNLLWPSTLDVVVRRRAADVRGALGVLPVIPAALRSTRTLSTQYAKRVGLPPAAGMSPRRLFDPRTGDVCIHSLSLNLFRVLSELAHAAAELAREAR